MQLLQLLKIFPLSSDDSITTTTFETQIVVEFGADESLSLDKPVRIEFPSQGGQEFSGFFKTGTDASTLIATCDSDADNLHSS